MSSPSWSNGGDRVSRRPAGCDIRACERSSSLPQRSTPCSSLKSRRTVFSLTPHSAAISELCNDVPTRLSESFHLHWLLVRCIYGCCTSPRRGGPRCIQDSPPIHILSNGFSEQRYEFHACASHCGTLRCSCDSRRSRLDNLRISNNVSRQLRSVTQSHSRMGILEWAHSQSEAGHAETRYGNP
jgi:hypothetical protein